MVHKYAQQSLGSTFFRLIRLTDWMVLNGEGKTAKVLPLVDGIEEEFISRGARVAFSPTHLSSLSVHKYCSD